MARLVAAQFPQWADLPVSPVELDGWDNTTFRLGDTMSVRLPSANAYVAQVEKEHRWLPVLGPGLPLPIPEPLALGVPALGFPRPWSVYRWIEGEPATARTVDDLGRFAGDLAAFLAALYRCDAGDGPAAGAHSHSRGAHVSAWDAQTRDAIERLGNGIDGDGAAEVWRAAVESRWEQAPVWVHGDVTGANLLVRNGRLSAVIDFGCSATGDPACDTTIAWTFLDGKSRALFMSQLPVDAATWARGRGWALWKALLELVGDLAEPGRAERSAARFGWRRSPREVVDEVIADHRRRS
ncbi:MAG: aminoglycoside phosphotransferase family protein [Dehalococcoidia bacterium]